MNGAGSGNDHYYLQKPSRRTFMEQKNTGFNSEDEDDMLADNSLANMLQRNEIRRQSAHQVFAR